MPEDNVKEALAKQVEETRALKEEIQECHEILDRVGTDQREESSRITQSAAQRLPARLIRFVCEVVGMIFGRK
jgi:hypothetical protein